VEDERIIELFFERSEQAITELSIKYDSLVKSIINNVLNNSSDVEECTNDTYLSIWNTIPPQKPMNLAAYLARVAKNTALNRYDYNTSKKRYSSYDMAIDELAELIPSEENVEEKILVNELSQAINAFLAEMSTEERVMFVARYWFGETVEEIAKKMSCNPKGVAVKLHRIRKKLRRYLEKERLL